MKVKMTKALSSHHMSNKGNVFNEEDMYPAEMNGEFNCKYLHESTFMSIEGCIYKENRFLIIHRYDVDSVAIIAHDDCSIIDEIGEIVKREFITAGFEVEFI